MTLPQGYISTSHMKWFLEAEGSRNYEDEDTLNALLRKLDTNGDGQVAAARLQSCSGLRVEQTIYLFRMHTHETRCRTAR